MAAYEHKNCARSDKHTGLANIIPLEEEFATHSPKGIARAAKYENDVDRGYAFVILACGFLLFFCCWGYIRRLTSMIWGQFSWSVFQRHYSDANFAPASSLSFVGTVNITSALLFGSLTGILASYVGYVPVAALGGAMITLGFFLASWSTQLWHLILTAGVLGGIGCSMTFVPVLALIPQWFVKWKALATGIVASGSGVGGFAWSLINARLIHTIGVEWTWRIGAFVCCALYALSLVFLRARNPPGRVKMDFKLLLQPSMLVINLGGFFLAFGYFPPIFYLSQYAGSCGISASDSAMIAGLFNIGSAFGRVLNGLGADWLGCFNALALAVILSAVALLCLLPFATTYGSLLGFALMYGFSTGGFQSLFPVVIVQLFGAAQAALLVGLVYTPWIFGQLVSSFIFGTIVESRG
ncbi:hypothetical protein SeMB42_g04467, partial [Synchytrium endobioticum]